MPATASDTATETIGALIVDLLRKQYSGRCSFIELSPAGSAPEAPTDLPAIQVRVNDARTDAVRGQVHGEVLCVVYTDDNRPLTVRLDRLTSRSGAVHPKYIAQPSGDLRRITEDASPTVSLLDQGTMATAHRWTISNGVPKVPTLRHPGPTTATLSVLATAFALATSRPVQPGKRAAITAQALGCTAGQVHADVPGQVENIADMTLLLRPTTGRGIDWDAARAAVWHAVDQMEGKALDGLGRLARAHLADLAPVPSGLRATVRVLVTATAG